MPWFLTIFSALLCGVAGGAYGGYMASRVVIWQRISSFEGKSGYFIAGMILVGFVASLVIALVVGRMWGGPGAVGFVKGLGYSLAVIAATITLLGALAWLSRSG
ncbi:MAG: hypothetical protein KIT16_02675 [Rhodospirillaceae bacterium]|nr:hypothetical protein [Rhodospirillaceae bacterium]